METGIQGLHGQGSMLGSVVRQANHVHIVLQEFFKLGVVGQMSALLFHVCLHAFQAFFPDIADGNQFALLGAIGIAHHAAATADTDNTNFK
jgi:hypothetical protein